MKILSAEYVLPVSSEPIQKGAIVIENDKIKAVGKLSEIKKNYQDAEVEDFGEAVIMPGFVNCHSHLELSIMRGFLDDVEHDFFNWLIKLSTTRAEKLTHQDLELSALLGVAEGASSGVTCFGDIGRYGRAGFNALKEIGLRGIVFQETEFSPTNENAQENFLKLKENYLSLKADETDLVKIGISPHAPYTVSRRLFELITDYALEANIAISIHAAESSAEEKLMLNNTGAMADFYRKREIQWVAPQLSSIEYLAKIGVLQAKPLLAHCIRTNQKDFELIAESGSSVAHCPKSNAKFGHRLAPFENFLDNNLKVGLGTDSVASNNVCDLLDEGRFAVLKARSRKDKKRLINAKEIIETITLGGAKALGLNSKIGSIEAGKQSDLVVISLENFSQQPINDIYSSIIFASNARDVQLTIVAGNEVYRNGHLKNIEKNDLLKKVKIVSRKMQEN